MIRMISDTLVLISVSIVADSPLASDNRTARLPSLCVTYSPSTMSIKPHDCMKYESNVEACNVQLLKPLA